MTIHHFKVLFFSPTGGTETIAHTVADALVPQIGLVPQFIDLTQPEKRQRSYTFAPDELILIAVPVYAGRIPNKLLPDLRTHLKGNNTPALAVCAFGNRSPDEAPRELVMLLEANGFCPVGVAAFACRHAFFDRVGNGRPDDTDRQQMRQFAQQTAAKLAASSPLPPLSIARREIAPYYTPLKADGTPAKFLKATPVTDSTRCTHCGLCAKACPMGSIDPSTAETTGICIKCHACVRKCPSRAKHFENPDFLSHVAMLEHHYTEKAQNLLIL